MAGTFVGPREFAARRRRLMQALGPGNAAVFVAGSDSRRNGDVDHPFRQDSTFFYLTGFEEPEAVAVFRPGTKQPYTLLVRPHDPVQAVWVGPRAGVEGACATYGAGQAFPIEELDQRLPELLRGVKELHYSMGQTDPLAQRVERLLIEHVAARREGAQRGAVPLEAWRDPEPLVDGLRLLKTPAEVKALRKAIDVTGAGILAAMCAVRPGMHEYEVQAVLEATYRSEGAIRDGFPAIVAAGANSCTLHYTANRKRIEDGDLLLMDTGAEWDLYSADVTRTVPANGRFTPAQRAVYDVVLEAQAAGIAKTKPGAGFHDVHNAALRTLVRGLVDLKVLKGDIDGLIEKEAYRPYFMHGTSHWLGLDVHDAGPYRSAGKSTRLEPGMVLTVEPGLYFAPETKGVPVRLKGIGIRIEDDVLVTERGRENLSEGIPSAPDALEAIIRG